MTKFPSIPRLSIVVPVGNDLAAFESSLISVLENRPSGCEVIVPHDGRYDDPFDLCDEVRFVVSGSHRLVDLIAASVGEARGRFTHVLADGVRATYGWTDYALEKFEHHDTAAVSPVIRDSKTQRVIAAGWRDTSSRLCQAAAAGQLEIDQETAGQTCGVYLQASFWRRSVLESLLGGFRGVDSVAATYALAQLAKAAGWRCLLASECDVSCDSPLLAWDQSTFSRGQRLRAIRNLLSDAAGGSALSAGARACLKNLFSPRHYAESLGQAFAPLVRSELRAWLCTAEITDCSDANVIRVTAQRAETVRRAA